MRVHARMVKNSERKEFLAKLFKEVREVYRKPGEEWSGDEKEFLPEFLLGVKENKLVLDLAGGYGRVTPYLMSKNNSVILADLSLHSLLHAKKILGTDNVDFVCIDMLHLPFASNMFDGVWFTQAFEYVPPDMREEFLESLRELLKKKSLVFINVAKVPNECSCISYVENYVYWRLIKRAPVVWAIMCIRLIYSIIRGGIIIRWFLPEE